MTAWGGNTRGRILRRLAEGGPATAKALLGDLRCSPAALAAALAALVRAGAVESLAGRVRGDARVRLYRIAREED